MFLGRCCIYQYESSFRSVNEWFKHAEALQVSMTLLLACTKLQGSCCSHFYVDMGVALFKVLCDGQGTVRLAVMYVDRSYV